VKVINGEIGGEKRILCYSLRVIKAIEEKFGGDVEMRAKLTAETSQAVDITCWLMSQLMVSGKKYADKMGMECPEPLSADDMLDLYDVGDLIQMQGMIQGAIASGTQQDVEATSKNAAATPAK
jgi:hypothetical protein